MRPETEIPHPKEAPDSHRGLLSSKAPVLYQLACQLLENGEKEQAAFLLQQAVDLNQDHAPSMYELAWIHLDKNEAKALLLFQQAAELNFAPAIFHLGLHYLIIAEKSRSESATTKAINLLQKAADLSYAPAMYELALRHIRKDHAYLALPLLKKAAKLNYAPAIFHLGLHHHRIETKEEEAKAVAFFQQAVELNFAPAMYELARIHLSKKPEDPAPALRLLEEAAKLNHDEAMLKLTEIFATKKNPLWDFRAIFWYTQYCRENSIDENSTDEDDIWLSDSFFTIDPRVKKLASLLLQRPIDQEALFSFIKTVSTTEEEDLLQAKEELLSQLMEEKRNAEEEVTVRKAKLSQQIEEALIKGYHPLLKESVLLQLNEKRLLKEAMLSQLMEE